MTLLYELTSETSYSFDVPFPADYRLVLNVREDTHKPFQLDVFKNDELEFSIRYISYETDLPFDAALFIPPASVTITEAKPNP